MNELLDLILLAADLEHLTYDPKKPGQGFVIETKRDAQRGVTATAIVTDGTLRVGDMIAAERVSGQVKALDDFSGKPIVSAEPSVPVRILGFSDVPPIGGTFRVGAITPSAAAKAAQSERRPDGQAAVTEKDARILRVILKADVSGSLEALHQIVTYLPLPEGMTLKIMDSGIGEITDGDIQHAISTGSMVIGFRTDITKAAENLAKVHKVKVLTSEIVYELVKALEAEAKALAGEENAGELEVLAIFGKKGSAQVVGGRVVKGSVNRNAAFAVARGKDRVGEGRLINLQQNKKDAVSVAEGSECGLLVEAEKDIKVKDHLLFR